MNVSFLTLYSGGIKQTITKVCITWLDVSDGAKVCLMVLSVEPIDKETLSQLHIQADML